MGLENKWGSMNLGPSKEQKVTSPLLGHIELSLNSLHVRKYGKGFRLRMQQGEFLGGNRGSRRLATKGGSSFKTSKSFKKERCWGLQ